MEAEPNGFRQTARQETTNNSVGGYSSTGDVKDRAIPSSQQTEDRKAAPALVVPRTTSTPLLDSVAVGIANSLQGKVQPLPAFDDARASVVGDRCIQPARTGPKWAVSVADKMAVTRVGESHVSASRRRVVRALPKVAPDGVLTSHVVSHRTKCLPDLTSSQQTLTASASATVTHDWTQASLDSCATASAAKVNGCAWAGASFQGSPRFFSKANEMETGFVALPLSSQQTARSASLSPVRDDRVLGHVSHSNHYATSYSAFPTTTLPSSASCRSSVIGHCPSPQHHLRSASAQQVRGKDSSQPEYVLSATETVFAPLREGPVLHARSCSAAGRQRIVALHTVSNPVSAWMSEGGAIMDLFRRRSQPNHEEVAGATDVTSTSPVPTIAFSADVPLTSTGSAVAQTAKVGVGVGKRATVPLSSFLTEAAFTGHSASIGVVRADERGLRNEVSATKWSGSDRCGFSKLSSVARDDGIRGPPRGSPPPSDEDGNSRSSSSSAWSDDGYGEVHLNFRTRNFNALQAVSWDQRMYLPNSTSGCASMFTLFASPRFWEKLDWTVRATFFMILPVLVLCLEPGTRHIFPLPTSVVALAFWISQPTLGGGLRELFIVLKGFSLSLCVLSGIIAIHPGPPWLSLLLLFFSILFAAFIAEETRRTTAYCLVSLIMQYISKPSAISYKYVTDYFLTLLIALGFAMVSFVIPYIRWSSEVSRHYIAVIGDSVSLLATGICTSFWVSTSLERQLNLVRLRQLRTTARKSIQKASAALSEAGYEPHRTDYLARLHTRMGFYKRIFDLLGAVGLVVEQAAVSDCVAHSQTCRAMGRELRDDLKAIASAIDTTLLLIADTQHPITPEDLSQFRCASDRFQARLAAVREAVMLRSVVYKPDESDILLGSFFFAIEELCEAIGEFQEKPFAKCGFRYIVTFPLRDLHSVRDAWTALSTSVWRRRTITRRLKEAIKLSTCITVAAAFQVYAMGHNTLSPVAGVDIIALVYKPTGADSFQYATNRLMGTVFGSLTGFLSVQIADGRRWVLYLCAGICCFAGAYVQAAPGYVPLGSAICNSVISIVVQYDNPAAALIRIQQNCFAILMYFTVSSLIWPMRARTKVKLGLDISLRVLRECGSRLLRHLDIPENVEDVNSDATALLAEMSKRIGVQVANLPGAVAEPTLDSSEFPEMPWQMLVSIQRKLYLSLFMMQRAYHTFMSSKAGDGTELSVHWVVLHRIAPYANALSEMFYAAVGYYLLFISKTAVVSTAHFTRIRHNMHRCHRKILLTFMATLHREVLGEGSDSAYSVGGIIEDALEGQGEATRVDAHDVNRPLGLRRNDGRDSSAPDDSGGDSCKSSSGTGRRDTVTATGAQEQQVLISSVTAREENGETRRPDDDVPLTMTASAEAAVRKGPDTRRVNLAQRGRTGYMTYRMTEAEETCLKQYLAARKFSEKVGVINSSFLTDAVSLAATVTPSVLPVSATRTASQEKGTASDPSRHTSRVHVDPTTAEAQTHCQNDSLAYSFRDVQRSLLQSIVGNWSFHAATVRGDVEGARQSQQVLQRTVSSVVSKDGNKGAAGSFEGIMPASKSHSLVLQSPMKLSMIGGVGLAARTPSADRHAGGTASILDDDCDPHSGTKLLPTTRGGSPDVLGPLHHHGRRRFGSLCSAEQPNISRGPLESSQSRGGNCSTFLVAVDAVTEDRARSSSMTVLKGIEALPRPQTYRDELSLTFTQRDGLFEGKSFARGDATLDGVEQQLRSMPFYDAPKREFVLTNRDIHSITAYLFCIRTVLLQLEELEQEVLEMEHCNEAAKKL